MAELRFGVLRTRPEDEAFELAVRELEAVDGVELESLVADALDFVLSDSTDVDPARCSIPTHGVWAFRHAGEPPGFWEIARGETAIGATLERLTPDGGVVLQRCFAAVKPTSRRRTVEAAERARAYMPARVARDLLRGDAGYLDAPPERRAPAPRAPTTTDVARYWARLGSVWARAQLASLWRIERWHVGVVRAPIERFLEPGFRPQVEWLPRKRRRGFYADPFLVDTGTGVTMLMEDWDDGADRGTIAAVDLEQGLRGAPAATALDTGTHMAYPFVLEHDGRVYCIPENHQRRGVFLYEAEAGGAWRERARLVDGFPAVDPTVVHHDGRWWLFCTDADVDSEGRLLVWSAPALLGPWAPHPANPVKADVRSSRPAGTPFAVDGVLYRPAQDSAAGYGNAVVINRVTRLTTTEFAEEPVARFGPVPGSRWRDGLHTLGAWGDLTAVDGKLMEATPRLIVPRLAGKLRRLVRRYASSRS